jgi:hypothetical protein
MSAIFSPRVSDPTFRLENYFYKAQFNIILVVLGGVMVTVFAIESKVRGFKPG